MKAPSKIWESQKGIYSQGVTFSLAISIALSAHLIAEVLRRFFAVSDVAFLSADAALIILAVWVVKHHGLRINKKIILLIFLYSFIGILAHIDGEHRLILIGIGLRPFILGLSIYAIIEAAVSSRWQYENTIKVIFACWMVLIFFVAMFQIDQGQTAAINQIQGVERGGRGDSYGASTTHWNKLLPKVDGGGAGGCPLLLIGMGLSCYDPDS